MNKPDLADAIARELDIPLNADWASNGDTITVDWHRAVGQRLGVPYQPPKPDHMRALLESVGVKWIASRHESLQDPLPEGDNLMKAAYQDLWDALRGRV